MKMQHIITTIAASAAIFTTITAPAAEPPPPYGAVPTEKQLQWQRLEWYAFVHFGPNTFLESEWTNGDVDPAVFNPSNFDAEKIVGTFKLAGMKGMVYTAKHHDGFCLWQTKSTDYSIAKSPWKNGEGDVVREFAEACKKYGMAFGVYISPWDRNNAEYARPGYLDVYYKQIEELLTGYGDIFEIWFDGANGGSGYYGGSNEVRDIGTPDKYYNFPYVVELIHKLQPNCIVWGAEGRGDAFWGGSEKGIVKYPYWNVAYSKSHERAFGDSTGGARWALNRTIHDKPTDAELWLPMEADTTISSTWFWRPGRIERLKSPKQLMEDVYLKSVGHGANLILDVPPNSAGELDPEYEKALLLFGDARRKLLENDFALHAKGSASNVRGNDSRNFGPDKLTDDDIETYWCTDDDVTTSEVVLELKKTATFDIVRLREQIRLGQRVRDFAVDAWVDGQWVTIDAENANGKSIGNQVMRRVPTTTTDKLRLRITKSRACPCISEFSLLKIPEAANDFSTLTKVKFHLLSHKRYPVIAVGLIILFTAGALYLIIRRRKRKNKSSNQ